MTSVYIDKYRFINVNMVSICVLTCVNYRQQDPSARAGSHIFKWQWLRADCFAFSAPWMGCSVSAAPHSGFGFSESTSVVDT